LTDQYRDFLREQAQLGNVRALRELSKAGDSLPLQVLCARRLATIGASRPFGAKFGG
jgi:hypothetical protein